MQKKSTLGQKSMFAWCVDNNLRDKIHITDDCTSHKRSVPTHGHLTSIHTRLFAHTARHTNVTATFSHTLTMKSHAELSNLSICQLKKGLFKPLCALRSYVRSLCKLAFQNIFTQGFNAKPLIQFLLLWGNHKNTFSPDQKTIGTLYVKAVIMTNCPW